MVDFAAPRKTSSTRSGSVHVSSHTQMRTCSLGTFHPCTLAHRTKNVRKSTSRLAMDALVELALCLGRALHFCDQAFSLFLRALDLVIQLLLFGLAVVSAFRRRRADPKSLGAADHAGHPL